MNLKSEQRSLEKIFQLKGFPGGSDSKKSACSFPGLRNGYPVFLPGEFHGVIIFNKEALLDVYLQLA